MSGRAGAALGAGIGGAIGFFGSGMIMPYISKQPGYTPYDDEVLARGVQLGGTLIGAIVGAAIGAGSEPAPKQVGTGDMPDGALHLGDGGVFP